MIHVPFMCLIDTLLTVSMYWFYNSYLRAGADMISTATYQASIMGFVKHLSLTSAEAEELLRKAVSLCMDARDNFWQDAANRVGQSLSFVGRKYTVSQKSYTSYREFKGGNFF